MAELAPPPNLLNIPLELRQKIYYHTFNPPTYISLSTRLHDVIFDLSILRTNRQIYSETRSLPLEFYPTGRRYDPSSKPFLAKSALLQPFQIAALRRFNIYYLYPPHLKHFVDLGAGTGCLFGEEGVNLDTLTIYADDWLSKEMARRWRKNIEKENVCFDLPRSSRWLQALCELKGWKMLDVVFKDRDIANESWQRGSFIRPLLEEFRLAVQDLDRKENKSGPTFTIWHKDDDAATEERVVVFRTSELQLHGFPEWEKPDLGKLRDGSECVLKPEKLKQIEAQPGGFSVDKAGFHVAERSGQPALGRQGYCEACMSKWNVIHGHRRGSKLEEETRMEMAVSFI